MATINTETFCAGLAEGYGWDESKVRRLESLLRGRGIYRGGVEQRQLSEALEEFERREASAKTGQRNAPRG